ncbi:TPA: toxin YdaT family protein [Escherichia coli]
MINRNQPVSVDKHDQIRDAVRAWAGVDGQDVVSALIIEEYQAQGGDEITFPDDLSRQRQKLFRFLDNHFNSERYRENVRQLTPAIPEGTEYSFEGESLICAHATFKSGTYGFLIPKGNQLNREHAFWHVSGIHPNPLGMDKS